MPWRLMNNTSELIKIIENGFFDKSFKKLYCADDNGILAQRQRYADAVRAFEEVFGKDRQVCIYSAPGRTEIIGNHTDHNNGLAMGAAVNLDIIAVTSLNNDNVVRVKSFGFDGMDVIDVNVLEPDETEKGKSAGLIRGIAAGFVGKGGKVGGFDAYTTSNVLAGSGLSSSAAFEMCLGAIINGEFNSNNFTPVEISLMGQLAENVFFGKPTGVLDQISCATGGAVKIDFKDSKNPKVTALPLSLDDFGFKMVITDTKGDHANLTPDYAAIRSEMESVAQFFGKNVLREVSREEFLNNIAKIREKCADRAVLRALHFFEECRRTNELASAIEQKNINNHLSLVLESGHSSFEYNQNAYSAASPLAQGVSLGLAASQLVLSGQGAWRLQGGGFAGTIQAYVPVALLEQYIETLENVFGENSCHIISIRNYGGVKINEKL